MNKTHKEFIEEVKEATKEVPIEERTKSTLGDVNRGKDE